MLYHHLDYDKTVGIPNEFWKITHYLALADKMDVFMRMNDDGAMEPEQHLQNL